MTTWVSHPVQAVGRARTRDEQPPQTESRRLSRRMATKTEELIQGHVGTRQLRESFPARSIRQTPPAHRIFRIPAFIAFQRWRLRVTCRKVTRLF